MADDLKPPPVPRKGDVLFRDDLPDKFNSACLNSALGDDQLAYTEGYRRGAQFLVEYVTAAHQDQDFLVYPIIFLYRHHIELVVKKLIGRAPYLMQEAVHLVFTKMTELGSARQVLLWFRGEKTNLPSLVVETPGRDIVWKLPVYNTIWHMLRNPMYAGASLHRGCVFQACAPDNLQLAAMFSRVLKKRKACRC